MRITLGRLDDELIKQINAAPLSGLFYEGWVAQANDAFYFIPLAAGPPTYSVQGRNAHHWCYADGRASGITLGRTSTSWHCWCEDIFPERLSTVCRIVRVGPSVDGWKWTQSRGESSVMRGVFPPGTLACNHRGHVVFYPKYHSWPHDMRPCQRGPQTNSARQDWNFNDMGMLADYMPPCLRCFHFPVELRHYDRMVTISDRDARPIPRPDNLLSRCLTWLFSFFGMR